jgi:UDP-glucuronate 4-epimerase
MAVFFITGVAGFVGAALAERLLAGGDTVYGLDNLNDYYDPALKQGRLDRLQALGKSQFRFRKIDLTDFSQLLEMIGEAQPAVILHMAAQPSVRYALKNPNAYCHSNLVGHFNMLEACRQYQQQQPGALKHLVYASSSSVYGGNEKVPFSEKDDVSRPASLYAATKRADELLSHSYAHMFGLPATAVRFFTVYGPWGRPDMSPMLFASAILEQRPLPVFNHGDLWRDFTYVDDIVEGVLKLVDHIPQGDIPHDIFNLGNSEPIQVLAFIKTLEKVLGRSAILDLQECPPTEIYKTYADTAKLEQAVGWKPYTPLEKGLEKFAAWFEEYHRTVKGEGR